MSESKDEIEKLVYLYAERMDGGDFAGVAALFASASYGGAGQPPLVGAVQVERALVDLVKLYDGTPRTQHVTTNLRVDVDEAGGRATARSCFTVLQSLRVGTIRVIVAGRYHDRFERRAGSWEFAERIVFMDLLGDLSDHLRVDPAAAE